MMTEIQGTIRKAIIQVRDELWHDSDDEDAILMMMMMKMVMIFC